MVPDIAATIAESVLYWSFGPVFVGSFRKIGLKHRQLTDPVKL
jgi:hypothetical protein